MKMFISVAVIILFASCGAGAGKNEKSDTAAAIDQTIINNGGSGIDSAGMAGSNLIAANDCLTCHKIKEKSFGPSYQQIADRYEMNQGNIENLADRIIKGGKGLWGYNAMTPHTTLSQSQAQEMVKYILSLRNSNGSK